MRENPRDIARSLAEQHGLEGALSAATDEILKAQAAGDNYRLSIWREVRQVLRDFPDDDGDGEVLSAVG